MSALTTDTTLIAADGVSDPKVGYPGLVAIAKKVNFAQANAAAATNYEFLDIPEGFVLEKAMVKELEKCPSGTIELKTKSDSALIGSAVTVGSADLAKSIMSPTEATQTGKVFPAGDMLCIVASIAMTVGEVEVVIVGYFPDGADSRLTPTRSQPWRKIGNTNRNVAEPDRLLGR